MLFKFLVVLLLFNLYFVGVLFLLGKAVAEFFADSFLGPVCLSFHFKSNSISSPFQECACAKRFGLALSNSSPHQGLS